jgi:hypothetical protein
MDEARQGLLYGLPRFSPRRDRLRPTIARRTWINTTNLKRGPRRKSKPSQAAGTSTFVGTIWEVELVSTESARLWCSFGDDARTLGPVHQLCSTTQSTRVGDGPCWRVSVAVEQGRYKLILSLVSSVTFTATRQM